MKGQNTAIITGDVVDAVEGVVPQSILEKLEKFSHTMVGNIVMTAAFILLVILVTMLVVRVVNGFFRRATQRMLEKGNPGVTAFSYLRYLALSAIYFAAINVVVSSIPVLESSMNRLFAAGGVLAVVLGFASQQAMGSLISGLMILTFKPFAIGDFVSVVSHGVAGTVEEISLRHTIIRTVENKRAIIPNDTMNSAIIENANHTEEKICLAENIGIAYTADSSRAMQIIREEIMGHPNYFDNRTAAERAAGAPPVVVRVQGFTDHAVLIRAFIWAKDSGIAYAMRADLLQSIKARCDEENISLAYPRLVVTEQQQ